MYLQCHISGAFTRSDVDLARARASPRSGLTAEAVAGTRANRVARVSCPRASAAAALNARLWSLFSLVNQRVGADVSWSAFRPELSQVRYVLQLGAITTDSEQTLTELKQDLGLDARPRYPSENFQRRLELD